MIKKYKWRFWASLSAYLLIVFVLITSELYLVFSKSRNVLISNLPGIESDFFNGFLVNGVDISGSAIVTPRSLIFPFVSQLTGSGIILLTFVQIFLIAVIQYPLLACWFQKNVFKRKNFSIAGFISMILLIFNLILFGSVINKNNFLQVFDNQLFEYFGSNIDSNQLEVFHQAILKVFRFDTNFIYCLIGLILTVAAMITITASLIFDKISLKTKLNIGETTVGELEVKETKFVYRWTFWGFMIPVSVTAVISLGLYLHIIFTSISLSDLGIDRSWFNKGINENGKIFWFTSMNFERWIDPFPNNLPSNRYYNLLTNFPLTLLIITVAFNWLDLGKTFAKKKRMTHRWFVINSSLMFVFLGFMAYQLVVFFSDDIFETIIRTNIFKFNEKNFLIKQVGAEQLEYQITQTAKMLKASLSSSYYILAYISIALISISGVAIVGANISCYWLKDKMSQSLKTEKENDLKPFKK